MSAIRLPVTGDWIDSRLIVGLSADGDGSEGLASVRVWTGDVGEEASSLHLFQEIFVSSIERAREVRDKIASLAKLTFPALPRTGDLVHPGLICGINAAHDYTGDACVAVWVTDFTRSSGRVQVFCELPCASIDEAIDCRDQIAVLCGMHLSADASGFDPNDIDSLAIIDDEDDEDDDGGSDGGGGLPEKAEAGTDPEQPEPKPARRRVKASERAAHRNRIRYTLMLRGWDPQSQPH